jgi:hypothetical protein
MKRKFAFLVVLSALAALALPTSSMAMVYPPSHRFEIAGEVQGPKITTSQGSCVLQSIQGTVPAEPQNQTWFTLPSAPTVSRCTAGVTMAMSGSWKMNGVGAGFNAAVGTLQVVGSTSTAIAIRYSSMPGCVLTGSFGFQGEFLNRGINGLGMSVYRPGIYPGLTKLTWANDGLATCSARGTQAEVSISGTRQMTLNSTLGNVYVY